MTITINQQPLRDAIGKIDEQLEALRPAYEEYITLYQHRNDLSQFLDDTEQLPPLPDLSESSEAGSPPVIEHSTSRSQDEPEDRDDGDDEPVIRHRQSRSLPSGDELDYVRKGPVTRQIVKYVFDHPGVKVREMAEEVGTSAPYAFDVIRNLEANNVVERHEGKVYPHGQYATKGKVTPARRSIQTKAMRALSHARA